MHREHQQPQAGPLARELACGVQPRPPGHRDVEDGEVYVLAQSALDRFDAVCGLRDDL